MPRHSDAPPEVLLIDRAAAAEIPSDQDVRDWAHSKRIFVSSVMSDLRAEREAVAEAIRRVGATPVLFEDFGGRDADPEDAYLGEVETADIYVGILGRRYGKPLKTRYSATHAEYEHAERSGLRISMWCSADDDREGPQQSFLDTARVFHVVPPFSSSADLAKQVEHRLRAIAAEELAPWCKMGPIVFRATEITDHGDTIDVSARVRSDDVAHALEGLRGQGGFRGDTLRLTWGGRSRAVSVSAMTVKTTAARAKDFLLTLEPHEERSDALTTMTMNGVSAADITRASLASALLQQPNPLASKLMGLAPTIPDPLAPLRTARVADEIARPLAELLVVEALVGSGRAARVSRFQLGARVAGQRRLALKWEAPRNYLGEPTQTLAIDGVVAL